MADPLDFLQNPPSPGGDAQNVDPADLLPQSVADDLLRLDGVDGAWIERDASGRRQVVLHYSRTDRPSHLPGRVGGMDVRITGGEPILAQDQQG